MGLYLSLLKNLIKYSQLLFKKSNSLKFKEPNEDDSNNESITSDYVVIEDQVNCPPGDNSFHDLPDLLRDLSINEFHFVNISLSSLSPDHFNNDKINNGSGLPDLINQKGNKDVPTDKARKYLEGLDGVKFNEIQVPDTLKKQLEYFDRDELLQLIAYQKKYLDFKETRIKDLENYIDNLVVKIIETEPLILMNASNVLTKSKNVI